MVEHTTRAVTINCFHYRLHYESIVLFCLCILSKKKKDETRERLKFLTQQYFHIRTNIFIMLVAVRDCTNGPRCIELTADMPIMTMLIN